VANNQIKDAIYNALNLSISSKMLSNLSAESPLRDFVSSIGPAATNPIANFGSIQNQPSATAMQNVDYRMSPLQEILNRLQLSGGYQSIDGQDVRGGAYGGRIGYSFPAGSNSLDVGLSGSGFSVNTPLGRQRQNQMTGADLSYNFGRNKLSAAYDRFGDNLFRLSYQRQFD
jgi:hypothetical protein